MSILNKHIETVAEVAVPYGGVFLDVDSVGVARFGFESAIFALSFRELETSAVALTGPITDPDAPLEVRVNVSLWHALHEAQIIHDIVNSYDDESYAEDYTY